MSDKYLKILGGLNINSSVKNKTIKVYSKNGDAKCVIGGKAAFKSKSNIIDWQIYKDLGQKDKIVYVINDILNLPVKIDDKEKLALLLNELNNLDNQDLIKVLTNSLELNESLTVALRRLYYIWADVIEFLTNESKIETPDLKSYTHKGFCPYEPKERVLNILEYPIEQFIDKIDFDKTNFNELYESIEKIDKELDKIIDEDEKDYEKDYEKEISKKDLEISKDLEKNMDIFMENYTKLFKNLEDEEKRFIAIAENIEKIADSLEQIYSL